MDDESMPSKMVDFMTNQLRYSLPRLLISVTGGALDFELSRDLEALLKRGLRKAAEATQAWVVTGGTNCGIMKYVCIWALRNGGHISGLHAVIAFMIAF